jgi:hypothetical protein
VLDKGQVLLAGMPAETLHAGGCYAVPPGKGAVARLDQYTTLWVSGGSRFTIGSGPGLSIELGSGSLMFQSIVPVEVRWGAVRAQGCGRFALAVPGGDEAKGEEPVASAGWSDWLFPRAGAAEPGPSGATCGPAAFLLLSGWTNLRVGEEELSLIGPHAVLGGDGESLLVGAPEGLLASAAAERRRLLHGLLTPRYRTMLAEFSARRASYLTRLAAGDVEPAEREDLTWRIALMDLLRETHQAQIERLSHVEGPREERAGLLEAGMECLGRLMQDVALAERRMAAVAH